MQYRYCWQSPGSTIALYLWNAINRELRLFIPPWVPIMILCMNASNMQDILVYTQFYEVSNIRSRSNECRTDCGKIYFSQPLFRVLLACFSRQRFLVFGAHRNRHTASSLLSHVYIAFCACCVLAIMMNNTNMNSGIAYILLNAMTFSYFPFWVEVVQCGARTTYVVRRT